VALDSSPLLGAGRVLDTWNLIGKALSTVVDCAAKTLGRSREEVVEEAHLSARGRCSTTRTATASPDVETTG